MQAMSWGCCRYCGSITGSLDGSASFSVTVPLLEGSRQEAKSTMPSCVLLWLSGNRAWNVCKRYQLKVTTINIFSELCYPSLIYVRKDRRLEDMLFIMENQTENLLINEVKPIFRRWSFIFVTDK
jgi:hypothetical protein